MSYQLTDARSVAFAEAVLRQESERLAAAGVPGELLLTGGSSLEGLLTKGDIDLHLRVTAEQFAEAVERLSEVHDVVHPEIWTRQFATFERPGQPPVGIAVTVIDSEHDRRFVRTWQRMRSDPAARETYNGLKRAGGDVEERKSRFFTSISEEDARE